MATQYRNNSKDPDERAKLIKDMIWAGKLEAAIRDLLQFMRDFCKTMEDVAYALGFSFSDLKTNEVSGAWDKREISQDRRELAVKVLKALDMAQNVRA